MAASMNARELCSCRAQATCYQPCQTSAGAVIDRFSRHVSGSVLMHVRRSPTEEELTLLQTEAGTGLGWAGRIFWRRADATAMPCSCAIFSIIKGGTMKRATLLSGLILALFAGVASAQVTLYD